MDDVVIVASEDQIDPLDFVGQLKIVVLHQGEIVEEGTHQELVTKPDGFYVKLSKMQIG